MKPCDYCGDETHVAALYPLNISLPGARDKCIGEYCSKCAERLANGEIKP